VRKLVGGSPKEACAVIETTVGEDYGESGVMVRTWRRSAFGAGAGAHVPLPGAT
jgi:hypothetical protein